jgi:hypothetical protein
MAETAGGRGSLLTRLQQSGLIKVGDKLVYRGSDNQEFEGDIILGEDSAVYVKLGNDLLKNEAVFVRRATGDASIPKNFKNTLSIGDRAFRDIHDDYKKANPRPERAERPPRAEGAAKASSSGRRARRTNVRLYQLVAAGKLTPDEEAWFESKVGRISGKFVQRERRCGFEFDGEFYPGASGFVRAAEEANQVPQEDRITSKWASAVHVGNTSIRDAGEQFIAERPPPQPKPVASSSSSSDNAELAQIREQIKKLKERERELIAATGGRRTSRPRRARRARKTEQAQDQTAAQ